ncbi:MAG: RidA family protein [Spirochaetota bacterium]|nr:RidA family protein [Spirochaetota bacterium]
MNKKIVNTEDAPKAIGPYSQAVVAGGFLFSAGQVGLDPVSMKLVDGGIEPQTEQLISNLKAVLAAEKLDFSHVVRTSIYLKDISDFQTVNQIYEKHFAGSRPARSTIQVAALPLNALIEMDLVAHIPG